MSEKQRAATSCGRIVLRLFLIALVTSIFHESLFGGEDPHADPGAEVKKALCELKILPRSSRQLASEMAQSRDDAWCLEGSLALLHDDWHRGTSFDALLESLEYLAGHTWRVMPDETPEAMLARVQREFKADRHATVENYRRLIDFERKRFDGPRLLDWRAESELWLAIVATMVRSHEVHDPAALWRAKMAEDPTHQRLYRYCYIAIARQRRVEDLDFDLVKPMLEKHGTNSLVDLAWQARVLHTYVAADVSSDNPELVAVRKLLLNNLRTVKLSPLEIRSGYQSVRALDQLFEASECRFERPGMLDAIADAGLKELQLFLRLAEVSASEKRDLLLSRKTTLACDDILVAEAIQTLQRETLLPILVDQAVWKDADRISFEMTGTWLDVTEALLAKTKYGFEPIGPSVLWIGRPERAARLREMLIRGQEKAVFASEKVITTLSEKTNIQFIETPLIDGSDYLEDLHNITIEVFGDITDIPITKEIKGVPLCLALELICEDAKFNWGTIDEIVVLAPGDELRRLDALRKERLRRTARMRRDEGKVARALRESTNIEFIETPLVDVADYLADLHDVPIRVTDAKIGLRTITADLKGMNLDLTLDLVMLQNNLAWYSNGNEIVLGSEKAIKELREKKLME